MRILIYITILIAGLASCTKNPIVIRDAESYSKVYIPQAVQTPYEVRVFVLDSVQSYPLSVFYGGSVAPSHDIHASFNVDPSLVDVFNAENGTNYEILPEGLYHLDKKAAIIKAGSFSSELLQLTITTNRDFPAFTSYLLPITMTTNDATINEELKTIYYLITASYAPGKIPRNEVCQLTHDFTSIFQYFDAIIEQSEDGQIIRFPYDADAEVFEPGTVINTGWNIFKTIVPIHSHFVAMKMDGTLTRYPVSSTGAISPGTDFGFGFGIFDRLVPFGNALLCMKPASGNFELIKYPLNPNMSWGSPYPSLGAGWDFPSLFEYENNLIAVDASGDMWLYPVSEDATVGTRTKVGSGWDMYKKVFAFNKDLIAIDYDNKLWRYKFDLRGFWALK
jgi:Domain of unknown function (DUF1735).